MQTETKFLKLVEQQNIAPHLEQSSTVPDSQRWPEEYSDKMVFRQKSTNWCHCRMSASSLNILQDFEKFWFFNNAH